MKSKHILFIFLVVTIISICCNSGLVAAEQNSKMEPLRDVLEKWVETKQIISHEKQKWQTQKEVLTERTRLLESQADDLEAKINEMREAINKSEEKRKTLADDHEKLDSAVSFLRDMIGLMEGRVLTLLDQLPEPVQEQVKPLSQEIPLNPEQTKLPISTRYQNLIGVLNFINKFNNAITVTTEVRKIDENQTVEVEVMYIGLGQAYFSNKAATVGGMGRPTSRGWEWERRDNIAPAVSSAIAIYNSQQTADYVSLPVEIVK